MRKQTNRDLKPLTLKALKIEEKGGRLVYACVGNYEGRGKQKLILHNAQIHVDKEGQPYFSYGDGNNMAVSVKGRAITHEIPSKRRK